jgi:cytochrome P450
VLVGTDPPEHTRLRRIAARALSARQLEPLVPELEAIVAARVDAFVGRGGGDAVAELAEPLAVAVFARVLGVPADGLAARRQGRGLSPDPRRAWRAFFRQAVGERREAPGDDLISALLEPGRDHLSEAELLDFLALLLTAGIDTTRDLVAALLLELTEHPAEWRRLRTEPSLIASAVEEGLRCTSPIQAMCRTEMSSGSRVLLSFAAANRDEERWPDASRFDVARYADGLTRANAHVAFGAGPHACPGAWLARLVAHRVLQRLLEDDVELAPAGRAEHRHRESFNSLVALPLHVRKEQTCPSTQT